MQVLGFSLIAAAGVLSAACGAAHFDASGASPTLALAPCHLEGLAEEVRCGVLDVFEDRDAASGRRIPVHVTVLPPLRRSAAPDPLFILAGGPGQHTFAPGKTYNFGFAIHDDHADWRFHHVSLGYTLGLGAKADVTADKH